MQFIIWVKLRIIFLILSSTTIANGSRYIYNKAFTDHSLCRHKGAYKCKNESRVK